MTVTASIIADSVSEADKRITTMLLRYPRFIHSEFMTHRVFSRNASSSRAIPVERLVASIGEDMAYPEEWGAAAKGMQSAGEVDAKTAAAAAALWDNAAIVAVKAARALASLGLAKQVVNRLLEPFSHITVVVTATEWDNFFYLRAHHAADPTFRALAYLMEEVREQSKPARLGPDDWHLPFAPALARSVAACARTSYRTHEGKESTLAEDRALTARLKADGHWSPFEHQAKPSPWPETRSRNFLGWIQYRAQVDGGGSGE